MKEYQFKTLTKERAIRNGVRYYFPNKPKKFCGHNAPRKVATDACVLCNDPGIYEFLVEVDMKYRALSTYEKSIHPELRKWTLPFLKKTYKMKDFKKVQREAFEPQTPPEEHRFAFQVYVNGEKIIRDNNGKGYTTQMAMEKAIETYLRNHPDAYLPG